VLRATVVLAGVLALGLAPRSAGGASLPVLDAPPPSSSEQLGANTGSLFNSGRYTSAQIDRQLAALARTGATVVRSDALWEDSEPQPPTGLLHLHRYDWSFDDRIVGTLAAQGLQWLPIIDYTASWAQSVPGQDHSPPASFDDYAAYAGALAARYGPGGVYWLENPQLTPRPVETYEIWNEPDNPQYWYPASNPAAYGVLYTRARAAISAAEPGAQVIIGGLMHPAWFLPALVAADPGLSAQIDGVAVHPYAATPAGVLAGVRAARLAMRAQGLAGVPLFVTEFGWTTEHAGARDWVPEGARPDYIAQTFSALGHTDCDVAAVLLYAWATPERNPANPEDWFGISPPGAQPSPDTAAFASGLRAAADPAPASPLCSAIAPVLAPRRSRLHRARHRRRPAAHHTRRRRS
jgi:hypothetical protein